MIEVYLTDNNPRAKLEQILAERLKEYKILTTESGKPYIEGSPLCFSYSHSGDRGLLAVSPCGIGADLELYRGKIRHSVIKRFPEREQAEIFDERGFLLHWTAREAYVKLYGLEIAKMWRRVEFFGGKIFLDGQVMPVKIRHYVFWCGVGAVCTEEKL